MLLFSLADLNYDFYQTMLSELPDEANKLTIILANRLGNSSQSKLFSITCGYSDCKQTSNSSPVATIVGVIFAIVTTIAFVFAFVYFKRFL